MQVQDDRPNRKTAYPDLPGGRNRFGGWVWAT